MRLPVLCDFFYYNPLDGQIRQSRLYVFILLNLFCNPSPFPIKIYCVNDELASKGLIISASEIYSVYCVLNEIHDCASPTANKLIQIIILKLKKIYYIDIPNNAELPALSCSRLHAEPHHMNLTKRW